MYNNSFVSRYHKLPFTSIYGGYSLICLAFDSETNEQVIVKKYHFYSGIPEAAVNEIHMLSQQQIKQSPYIVKLLSYYQHNQQRILILEKCEYDLAGKQQLPLDQRLSAMRQLALALETLHSMNCAHRDIKPANLLISAQGVLKLCDFGLSGRYNRSGGTREYQAPETFINGQFGGKDADIWSYGITWLDLLCSGEQGGFWACFTSFLKKLNHTVFKDEASQSAVSDFSQNAERNEGYSDKQIVYLIERLIGSDNCQRCVDGSCQPLLLFFLQFISASTLEGAIIQQCLKWNAEDRIQISQILQYMHDIPLVPISAYEFVQKTEREPILLDQEEAPLASLFESCEQQCRDNMNASALDVCALEWSMQSDLGEQGL